jgi:hypothetical protein
MTEEEEAYEEALRLIREAEKTGAVKLEFNRLALNRLPPELERLISLQSLILVGGFYDCASDEDRQRKEVGDMLETTMCLALGRISEIDPCWPGGSIGSIASNGWSRTDPILLGLVTFLLVQLTALPTTKT